MTSGAFFGALSEPFSTKPRFSATNLLPHLFLSSAQKILNCQTKPKGVTTQMKALDEYFLMVLFVLVLKSSFSYEVVVVVIVVVLS